MEIATATEASFGTHSIKRHVHLRGPAVPDSLLNTVTAHLETCGDTDQAERARWLVEFGAVYLNHKRVIDATVTVGPDDIVRIHLEPKRYDATSFDLGSRIVRETENYIVIDKPSGLPVHPTLDNLYENAAAQFAKILGRPLHVTHRLDVPTSGLLLLAKTKKYQSLFNRLITARALKKTYQGIVAKPIAPGILRHFMKETVRAPKEVSREKTDDFKNECLLEIKSVEKLNDADLYRVTMELLTGRTHQIRAQLAFEGSALLGDEMYGGIPSPRFGLHASELEFVCPLTAACVSLKGDYQLRVT